MEKIETTIEVTWEVKPKSGITTINITDMVEDEKAWNKLPKDQQAKLINTYLIESDSSYLRVLATEW